MNNKEALQKAYQILSPFSDKQKWEFNNNLVHLNFLTKHINKDKTIFDAGCGIGILDMALTLLEYKVEGGDKYLFATDSNFAVNDLEKLQDQQKKIEDQDRPDLYKQTKAIVDLAEAKQNIIKKYKSIVEESESKSETPKGDTNILNIFGDKDKEVMKKLMGGMNFEIPKQVKKEEIKEVKVDVEN